MKRIIALVTGIALTIFATALLAQDPGTTPDAAMQRHREMMPLHVKMMEEQKAQDAEIDRLVAEMKSTGGEKRVDAIVAVLVKLIEQRKAMHAEMATHLDK